MARAYQPDDVTGWRMRLKGLVEGTRSSESNVAVRIDVELQDPGKECVWAIFSFGGKWCMRQRLHGQLHA